MAKGRPFVVTILAILEIIVSLFFLGNGALLITKAASFEVEIPEGDRPILGSFVTGLFVAIGIIIFSMMGIIFIIIGLIAFLIAYGLSAGRGWAWTLCLIFSIIGTIIGILSLPLGIISLIINILILYYLTKQQVKAFFGKGASVEGPPPPPT